MQDIASDLLESELDLMTLLKWRSRVRYSYCPEMLGAQPVLAASTMGFSAYMTF